MTRTDSRRARTVALGAAGAMALAGTVAVAAPAAAAPGAAQACEQRTNNTVAQLTDCVTLDGVMEHLEAFQGIAEANGGNRASGTPGYDASVEYVEQRLKQAGWEVSRQEFQFPFFQQISSAFSQTAPDQATYAEGADYAVMTYSASADVTATAQAVDVVVPPPAAANGNTSGCEATDFTGFTRGNIALVQRGTCPFGQKVANAQAAGASAVVVFNEGQEGRTDVVQGTLGAPGATIPAIGVSYALGSTLDGDTLRVAVEAVSEFRDTENVIAELPGRTSDNVVMAGAHLDSVPAGPGINDNGSGSAALIEVAENLAEAELTNTVRFAWWGAEELGLQGSNHYVAGLDQAQRDRLALYLNFDMVGSPNFARFIYDGDLSAFPAPSGVPVPEGSDQIEYVFEDYYEEQELFYEGTEFSGRSDYQAFIGAGIPSGGLFTGAEGVKQGYQAEAYGGEAGIAYDPNYHQVGDDIANLDPEALDQNSDAIAYAVLTLAYDTERVNGVAGGPVPGGTFEGDPEAREYRISAAQPNGGGGLHAGHDHDHGGDAV
ncbi:M28 family metallopeptidase [Geodermatophilus poikilotrophus]|uniref:PA domain-containing protein n=1 Tax=Geodermatophilus poikilotrophus TaxID=1333667 RepID=A0A1I0IM21_9ACTN|nr:M28 family metallopeptidase [Geodermatophilus poikilotrophus]SET97400.1 PA domain-containing protein [Geodermatophilus poikilotrophus]